MISHFMIHIGMALFIISHGNHHVAQLCVSG